MFGTILIYVNYIAILLFGLLMSFAYAGIRLSEKRNILAAAVLFVICGSLQLAILWLFDVDLVWKLYPLITHAPLVVFLLVFYRKRLVTVLSAVTTAYLCCQPAKWLGLLVAALTNSVVAEQLVRTLTLLATGILFLCYTATSLSKLFNKDIRSICIFGGVPMVYYLFDYITGIYTSLWVHHQELIAEFLPFFLCGLFMVFCVVYYKQYEQKSAAEHQEHLIRIFTQQQATRIETVRQTEKEIRILRHDMRLFLNSVALCLENGEPSAAKEMIDAYAARVENTRLERFCDSDMVNYVLSDCSEKCRARQIPFSCTVEIGTMDIDEMLFCSILSNALDNALNAQDYLPCDRRKIKVTLKQTEGKLLLSVKNKVHQTPVFSDKLPVTTRKGHGYGTQSIRYITEQLGGNCQFSAQDDWFILRVVL